MVELPFGKFLDLRSSEPQDLVNVFEAIGVATQRKVGKGDQEGSDVLNGEIWSCLVRNMSKALQKTGQREPTLISSTTCFQNTSKSCTSSGTPRNLRTGLPESSFFLPFSVVGENTFSSVGETPQSFSGAAI